MKRYVTLIATALVLSACLALPFAAPAQDGSLDLSFDTDGIVTTPIGNASAFGYSVAIQSDGKMVVGGHSVIGTFNEFTLVRYDTDGSLDTTFDTDGIVTTHVGTAQDFGRSVAIQSDGKIVLAGTISDNIGTFKIAIVRYNTDGSLDTTFDNDGIVTTSIGPASDVAYFIALQSDDKILLTGYSYIGAYPTIILVRYNTDGSLDTTFDTDGKVTTPVGDYNEDTGYSIATQSDGKILVSGITYSGPFNNDIALIRYNTNGSLDSTFDADGIVTTPVGTYDDVGYSVVVQSDGKIVVAGGTYFGTTDQDIAVARYNSDGSSDTTFDGDGKVITPIGTSKSVAFCAAIQPDGKIVVGGRKGNVWNDDQFALVRYNADGSLDPTFDTDGIVTTAIGDDDYGYSMTLQSDGKIVVSGWSLNGSNYDFAVARYNNSIPTGINEADNQTTEIKIYPNPFSSQTTLNSGTLFNNATLTVYSLYGQQVKQLNNLSGHTIPFHRDNLPTGLYLIQLTQDNKIISTNKLIITE